MNIKEKGRDTEKQLLFREYFTQSGVTHNINYIPGIAYSSGKVLCFIFKCAV